MTDHDPDCATQFSGENSTTHPCTCKNNKMKINLSPIRSLYKKVICVEEYYHPYMKWTNVFPDGTDIRDPENYYKELNMKVSDGNGEITFNTDLIERVVKKCIDSGATIIQFKCTDKDNEYCYPDYKVTELIS